MLMLSHIDKIGGWRWNDSRHSHHFWHFFQEIRTLTVNKHTTLVEIGLTKMWYEETNEASWASQQNLSDFVKLEERIVLWYYHRAWVTCVTTTINTDILNDDN